MAGREEQDLTAMALWANPAIRNPLLFSVGIHILITIIVFIPTSFFHFQTTPEIYSVELIDLSDPQIEPEPWQPSAPQPEVKPLLKEEPAVSTKPVLSTRNIPKTPSEIKILRPRRVKIDLRKNQLPIDSTMVFAALQRLQKQEQEQLAQEELDQANEAVREANDEVLQALRQSILTRQPHQTSNSATSPVNANPATQGNSGQQGGQRANTIRSQYIATMGQHIGGYWRLPEGQKWDNNLSTIVIVKIKTDGIVISSKIDKSSKSKQFDKFVIETIEKASPLPPIPTELQNKPLKLHFYPQGLQ